MRNFITFALVAASAAGLCANENGGNGLSAWATGHVSVKIVPTLTIKEDKALNFGRVLQGVEGSISIYEKDNTLFASNNMSVSKSFSRGEFTINAPDREDFQVSIEDALVPDSGFGKGKIVTLTNGTDTLTFDATIYCDYQTGAPAGNKNAWKVYVGGTLEVPAEASVGTYKGTYKLIATYL